MIGFLAISINWFNPIVYYAVRKTNSEYQKYQETKTGKSKYGMQSFIFVAAAAMLSGTVMQSYEVGLQNYYEQKWNSNYNFNTYIFDEEEHDSGTYNNMGSIEIQYCFPDKEKPTGAGAVCFTQEVSAYDTLILNRVDLENKKEADAFANYYLSAYYPETSKRFAYRISVPENLNQYSIDAFISQEDNSRLGMGYIICYQQDDLIYTTPVILENQNLEGAYQFAQQSVSGWAESMGIELPSDYKQYISVKRE